jgi:hypothetical protein
MTRALAAAAAIAAVALFPSSACAYLDPGTGSYVAQIIIAAVVGSGFAVKIFWRRILRLFRRTDDHDAGRDA